MQELSRFKSPFILLIPIFGMVLFILLYIIAAIFYPGGNWSNLNHQGFSFWNNYLCDLLDYYAVNGEVNSARFLARSALVTLCISLIIFWCYLPRLFLKKNINSIIMKTFGIMALVASLFLASGTHDIVIRIAGVFGVIAFIAAFIELFKNHFYKLLVFGVYCLIIFLINYYIYETGSYLKVLPVFQKITFLSFIFWFGFLDMALYRKVKSHYQKINYKI